MGKIEFPRWIYKGKSEKKIVESLEEYQTALSDGWRKGVIDEAEVDDSEKLEKISDDVRFIRKEVKKIAVGVDALQTGPKALMEPEVEVETEVETEVEPEVEPEVETMTYRQMLEANAKKLKIKFGINTSNSQLAAMIQRRG